MTSQGGGSSRRSLSLTNMPSQNKKKTNENASSDALRKSLSSSRSLQLTGERTVKRLRLSRALTVPESTTISEACRRMAARRVDALLLTDSNALLCGILTDKDLATRVIACGVNVEETPVSKVMTRNPVFVLSDTLAVEALQKMVNGKFRHLPVVENGEVVALLDIAKCLYDAIARMERAAEKGKAIAAAVEGVEKSWGTSVSGPNTFIETLRERMFRPSLSTIIPENSKIVTIPPTETVLMATKKMLELRVSSAVVTVDNKPLGILTSKDILMRLIAQNLPPESTLVEKVMTPNPECASIDTPIVDALHTMHDGKFLHLPVVDREGNVVAVVDVIHITHAAVATVGNASGVSNEAASSMMQKFWDSAMALSPTDDDDEMRSEGSLKLASEETDTGRNLPYPSSGMPNTFSFKLEDRKGRMHRFSCDTRSLTDVVTAILQRVGDDIDRNKLPQILYEDEDRDKVVLASDSDLAAAVEHARLAGWKGLRLHLEYSGSSSGGKRGGSGGGNMEYAQTDAWASAYSAVAAGAALVAGLGVLAYLKRSVISSPRGPTPNSEFEHSSIPATIKKIFNLSSNFLTHRDAWAGTFEDIIGQLTSPRTDCPVTLPEVTPLRKTDANENSGLSEFQSEVVQLAAVLNGDHFLSSFPNEISEKMSVKEAHEYTKGAVSRFIRASKEAIKLGADESAIVDMRSSLTTRSSMRN